MKHIESIKLLFTKHQEIILYLFFGVLATVVSITSFTVLYHVFSLNEHLSNIISWILAVSFAFITNKTWVFKSDSTPKNALLKQLWSFFCGRIFTLGIEEVIIIIFISLLGFEAFLVKMIAQIVVIVLNYFVSKSWVFKNRSR